MFYITRVFRRIWLPLFLLAGVSWLFAPAYYHDYYGTLHLISSYESGHLAYSWVFRFGDILAALLLVAAVWLFGIWRRDRRLAWIVLLVGVLSAADGLFADRCNVLQQTCQGLAQVSSTIHDVESVITPIAIVGLGIYHALRYRQAKSSWFVGVQVLLGLAIVSGLFTQQQVITAQYGYELLIISWLAWLVSTFAAQGVTRTGGLFRHLFGLWALVNGVISITVSVTHFQLARPLFEVSLVHSSALAGQHGVLTGVIMLYIARQVYQGQRRAAFILAALFGLQAVKYSVITPSPVLLTLNIISLAVLLYVRRAFDRNTLPLPFSNRAKDAAILVGGVLLAVTCGGVLTTLLGHGHVVQYDLRRDYARRIQSATRVEDRFEESVRLKRVSETLLFATSGLVVWSLFRPARFRLERSGSDHQRVQEILRRYSLSSEDFFKLWPLDKSYYFASKGAGFVAYRVVGSIAFALADPIAAPGQRAVLLRDFATFCRNNGWTVCFLMVCESSKLLYEDDYKLMKIGSSAAIDIAQFSQHTSNQKWWRWQRNRAAKAGLQYEVADAPHATNLLHQLSEVSDAWLEKGGHNEQGFVLGYYDNDYLQKCRLHLVRGADGRLLAFANELPTYNRQTQSTVDMIRYLPGENGTMPFLLMQLIYHFNGDDTVQTFDLGFVPLAGVNTNIANAVRRVTAGRFSSAGLEQFKNKFDPSWQPNYLAYNGDLVDLARITASLESLLKKPTTPQRDTV